MREWVRGMAFSYACCIKAAIRSGTPVGMSHVWEVSLCGPDHDSSEQAHPGAEWPNALGRRRRKLPQAAQVAVFIFRHQREAA